MRYLRAASRSASLECCFLEIFGRLPIGNRALDQSDGSLDGILIAGDGIRPSGMKQRKDEPAASGRECHPRPVRQSTELISRDHDTLLRDAERPDVRSHAERGNELAEAAGNRGSAISSG